MVISLGGMAVGQGLLNVADPGNADLFILVSILVSMALLPMLLSNTRGPAMVAPTPISIKEVYKASPTGLISAFGVGILQGGSVGMGAVYAGLIGLPVSKISLFMTMLLIGGVCFQWTIGRLSDRYDRRMVLTAVTFLAAGVAVIANMVAFSFTGLLAATFLFGGMMFPMYSLALAYANDYLKPEQMVGASGTLVLVGGAGAFLGPTLVAAAIEVFGPPGFFWSLAAVHATIGAFILYRMTQRPSLPLDEQGSYAIMPRSTPVAGEMFGEAATESSDEEAELETEPDDAATPAKTGVSPATAGAT
jgi:MFS family permease